MPLPAQPKEANTRPNETKRQPTHANGANEKQRYTKQPMKNLKLANNASAFQTKQNKFKRNTCKANTIPNPPPTNQKAEAIEMARPICGGTHQTGQVKSLTFNWEY